MKHPTMKWFPSPAKKQAKQSPGTRPGEASFCVGDFESPRYPFASFIEARAMHEILLLSYRQGVQDHIEEVRMNFDRAILGI